MNFYELLSKMKQIDQSVTEEKADKDYDGDGEVESGKDEYMGSRMKAAEKDKVDEEVVDECGMPGMAGMPNGMMGNRQPDNVSMNVSMNAQGAGGIRDLMNVLKDIQDGPDNMDGPGMMDGPGPDIDDANMMIKKLSGPGSMIDDDFANEPDETYQGIDAVTHSGDDLHSKGDEAPPVNGGGNPRQVKTGETYKLPSGDLKIKLESLYKDIKSR
jgi:hypothetical protein